MKVSIEEFMNGKTPKETIEEVANIIVLLTAEAFAHGYKEGHKDGMTEAVTTITE